MADLGGGNDPRIDFRADVILIGELPTLLAIASTIILQTNPRKSPEWAKRSTDLATHVRKSARFAAMHEHPAPELGRNFYPESFHGANAAIIFLWNRNNKTLKQSELSQKCSNRAKKSIFTEIDRNSWKIRNFWKLLKCSFRDCISVPELRKSKKPLKMMRNASLSFHWGGSTN